MARMAVEDGIVAIITTPHQLGPFRRNDGNRIREQTEEMARRLRTTRIPLRVLPGADVRIEPDLIDGLNSGEVLSLADRHRHILLELPHELYFPLESLIDSLRANGMTGILSHPERNQGILSNPEHLAPLVDAGCLMQVTASSLLGEFGRASLKLAERMLREGLVHFLATDGHGVKSRRPRLHNAKVRAAEITNQHVADTLCRDFPQRVAGGKEVPTGRLPSFISPRRRRWFTRVHQA